MDRKPEDEGSEDVIDVPEPAHSLERHPTESDDELEATELRQLGAEPERPARPTLSHVISPGKPMIHWWDPVKKFWRHQVRITVPHVDCRDHLGECMINAACIFYGARAISRGVAVSMVNFIGEEEESHAD